MLRDRWLRFRDRLLGSPGFQRWAASFLLTRGVAQSHARALFDICAGFVYSQVLAACVELDIFERVAEAPQSAAELAGPLKLTEEAAARLLAAAESLDLLENRGDGRYGLGPLGAAMRGNPGIAAMVAHHRMLYADLADPVALLRGEVSDTRLAAFWPYAGENRPENEEDDRVAAYSALMSASQPLISQDVLDAYPFQRHRQLLDVGGGEGAFIRAVAARVPSLSLGMFDLPPVAARARVSLADAGLEGRIAVTGGDFDKDALPEGADIITLVRIVHDHDDETVLRLMGAIHRALPPGGVLLIAEPMSGTAGAAPVGDAYFGFYLMAMGRGRPRTPDEIGDMLTRAGFASWRVRSTRRPLLTKVIEARR